MTDHALITDATELEIAQRALERAFESRGTRPERRRVADRSGSYEAEVSHLAELDLWYGHADFAERYWNGLFRGAPDASAPALELNVAKTGGARATGGAFVRDGAGRTWLAHTGRLGGGKRGVGKRAFLAHLQRERARVGDEELILLAPLDDARLPERVEAYLRDVEAFRRSAGRASVPAPDPEPLLSWCRLALAWPPLEAEERTYKLKLAARLDETRRAVLAGDPAAPELLRRAFRAPNNITSRYAHTPFLAWVAERSVDARAALARLWDADADVTTRLTAFLERLPAEVLSGRGTRTNLAAYLQLGLDAPALPPYVDTPLRAAWKLAAYEPEAEADEVALYTRELELLEALRARLGGARDLLDVQGALWTVLQSARFLADLSPANRARLQRLRAGDRAALPLTDTPGAGFAPRRPMQPLNQILYGPPGTGKTYRTMKLALEICGVAYTEATRLERYRELVQAGRVAFVTFHQSYSYEDFVEGIRPKLHRASQQVHYRVRAGVFRETCERALAAQDEGLPELPARVWKMSLGDTQQDAGTTIFARAVERNLLLLGYGSGVDFAGCDTKSAVRARFERERPDREVDPYAVRVVHRFKNRVRVGDLVFVSNGNKLVRAIGRVSGDFLGADAETGWLARPVEWLATFAGEGLPVAQLYGRRFTQQTLYALKLDEIDRDGLQRALGGAPRQQPREEREPYVLIVDEINRANISKVLGELITLLEPDKRLGAANEQTAVLPYSRKRFGVPANLYVIGTMNTADRSIAFLDLALRRRFEFVELKPDAALLAGRGPREVDLARLLEVVNRRIELLLDADHTIGHAYFMSVETLSDLRDVFVQKLLPQLLEYFFQDWSKVAAVLGQSAEATPGSAGGGALLQTETLSAAALLGAAGDDLEDRLLHRVSPAFLDAEEEALPPFFEAVWRGDSAS